MTEKARMQSPTDRFLSVCLTAVPATCSAFVPELNMEEKGTTASALSTRHPRAVLPKL